MNNEPTIPTTAQWITASFLGWLSGALLILLTSGIFDVIGLEGFQCYLGISLGAGVGFFQWRALRPLGIGTAWIWSAVAGLGLPFLVIDLLKHYAGLPPSDALPRFCMSIGGVLVGLAQARLLKGDRRTGARWMFGSWGGWMLAAGAVMLVDHTAVISDNNMVLFALNLTLILSGGVVLGAVTAPVLNRVLSSTASHQRSSAS